MDLPEAPVPVSQLYDEFKAMLVNSTIRLAEMTHSVGTKTYTIVKLCTTVSGSSLSSSHTTKARLNPNPWITTTCRSFSWFVVSCTNTEKNSNPSFDLKMAEMSLNYGI